VTIVHLFLWFFCFCLLFLSFFHSSYSLHSSHLLFIVVKVNGSSGEVDNMFPDLSGADGVEVWCPGDESESEGCLLYFNEVISGRTIFVYDLDAGKIINQFLPPQPAEAVDDFCLSKDGQTIYAADFVGGAVISFFSNGTSASSTIVASGFTNPTAVR
jgi:hypothetical protein